jgi:thiamine monophosphate synthase
MKARHQSWPRIWLLTDERMGDQLWQAIDRLPGKDAGIVFRHHSHPPETREALARRIADIAKRRGFTLAIARDAKLAVRLGANLVHNPSELPCPLPFSRSVHSVKEAEAARTDGATLVFVSPIHPTSSHPGQKPLGKPLALRIAKAAGVPAISLGGMNARNFAGLRRDGFYGWAGIDAWIRR